MKAADILEDVSTLDGAASSGVKDDGLLNGHLLSGIEFVQARPATERSLRAAWIKRRGNGATPLVFIADDWEAEDQVLVLGPNVATEPLWSVDGEALLHLITEVSKQSGLRAVRTFAREIGRCSQVSQPSARE